MRFSTGLAGALLGLVAWVLGEWAISGVFGVHIPWSAVTFSLGALVVGVIAFFCYLGAAYSGAVWYFVGSSAEKWTREEFKKSGADWQLVPNLPFLIPSRSGDYETDVDLVAVGRGGILAVEIKFSSSRAPISRAPNDVRQSRSGARRVRDLLQSDGVNISVEPVLVYWGSGPASSGNGSPAKRLGDVRIIHGSDLALWLDETHSHEILDPFDVDLALNKLEEHKRSHAEALRELP